MSQIEFVTGTPNAYSNYVWIEFTKAGTYRFDGLSNAAGGEPTRYSSAHYRSLESAKTAAVFWAFKNGVSLIYLPSSVSTPVPTAP